MASNGRGIIENLLANIQQLTNIPPMYGLPIHGRHGLSDMFHQARDVQLWMASSLSPDTHPHHQQPLPSPLSPFIHDPLPLATSTLVSLQSSSPHRSPTAPSPVNPKPYVWYQKHNLFAESILMCYKK